MRFWRSRSRVVALVAVAALLVGGAWLVFKPSPKTATTTPPAGTSASLAKAATIETADFKYAKPAGWAQISPKTLESTGAVSGIGRPTEPVSTFSIKDLNTIPKDSNDLKNSTLDGLKQFSNFRLVSDINTKVDGQAGQKFTYNFSDASGNNKTTQQMNVIPYKQKTFFLLFSSATADYDKQTGDFDNILVSFHFK